MALQLSLLYDEALDVCLSLPHSLQKKTKSCKNVPDRFLLGCEVVNYFNHVLALSCIALSALAHI